MLNGSILQKLQAAHEHTDRPLKLGVYYKQTLVALCHALEDHILEDGERPLVLAAFQRGKWYQQEADRYQQLVDRCDQVVILAQPEAGFMGHPTHQEAGVHLVNLQPEDPVAQEWHLIILSPTYQAMVLCQELSDRDYGPAGQPSQDLERKFYGFWTFEPQLVEETVTLTIDHVARYDRSLADRLHHYCHEYQRRPIALDPLKTVVSKVVDYLTEAKPQAIDPPITGIVPNPDQAIDRNLLSNEIQAFLRMGQLLDQADLSNPCAAAEIATLTEALGQLLDLPMWQLRRLRLASLLHRLDPLQSGPSLLDSSPEERYSCPLVPGAQVLRRMPRLRAIAQIITHITERWDGRGEPAGLQGTAIPLESRIIGLVAAFQQQVAQAVYGGEETPAALMQALNYCQTQRESHWDPQLLDQLTLLVNGLLHGWNLPFEEPKVNASLWLLDGLLQEENSGKTIVAT